MANTTAINTHTPNPIIEQVNISGTAYDIHDKYAVHGPEDLDRLGIAGVFNFAGVVANVAALKALTGVSSGDVYLVSDTKTEYVYLIQDNVGTWHEFGGMHQHNHSASVSGSNTESAVSVTVPAKVYIATTTKLSATQAAPGLTKEKVLGDGTTVSVSGKGVGDVTTTGLDVNLTPAYNTFINKITVGTAAKAVSDLNTTSINNPSASTVTIAQHTFADVDATKVEMGTPISIPNVTTVSPKTASLAAAAADKTASYISNLAEKTASKVTLGTAISVPNVTNNTKVTASKITGNTTKTASKATETDSLTASLVTTETITPTRSSFSVSNGILTIGNVDTPVSSLKTVTPVTIPQYTFADVTATATTYEDKDATYTTLGSALSIPNVTKVDPITAHYITKSDVTIKQHTFSNVPVSEVTLGTEISVPNVAKTTEVIASKATAAANKTASLVTLTPTTVATGIKSQVNAVPSVSFESANALTGVTASLATGSTESDAVTVVTGVDKTDLSATVNAENIEAVVNVTEGKITLKTGTTGDVTLATGISSSDTTLSGSGTAAAQTWSGSVTVNNWSDSDQTITP